MPSLGGGAEVVGDAIAGFFVEWALLTLAEQKRIRNVERKNQVKEARKNKKKNRRTRSCRRLPLVGWWLVSVALLGLFPLLLHLMVRGVTMEMTLPLLWAGHCWDGTPVLFLRHAALAGFPQPQVHF